MFDRTTHHAVGLFKAAVQVRPEILECHRVAGGFDDLLKTRVANRQANREFVGSVIWALPGVRETRTCAVMEDVKSTAMLPIRAARRLTCLSGMLENSSTMTEIGGLDDINLRIAHRVSALRAGRGLSLEALAARSGVSRSTLSLIERGETSATAVILEKVAGGLGVALAALFEAERETPGPLMRRAEQAEWRDPASGYLRRNVSPSDHPSPLRIVEVEFPAGQRVVLEGASAANAIDEQVWVLEGTMTLTLGRVSHRLEAGDCLALHVDGPIEFRNPTRRAARYAVVIATDAPPRALTRQVPR